MGTTDIVFEPVEFLGRLAVLVPRPRINLLLYHGVRWAALMQRTFGFDVLACPRCGGRLRLIALIEDAAVVGRILRHLGVTTEVPAPRPARAPPRAEEMPDWAGWDHETSICTSSV